MSDVTTSKDSQPLILFRQDRSPKIVISELPALLSLDTFI